MKKLYIFILVLILIGCNSVPYKEVQKNFKTHNDVAAWLKSNYNFDKSRQRQVLKSIKKAGSAQEVVLRNPEQVYENGGGYCGDAANFVFQNLKQISPDYNPRFVFIKNSEGRPHHWVTAFDYQGKLFIMDYGAGNKWAAMHGVHGPYDNLSEYSDYLASLVLPDFGVESVKFRNFPGYVTP